MGGGSCISTLTSPELLGSAGSSKPDTSSMLTSMLGATGGGIAAIGVVTLRASFLYGTHVLVWELYPLFSWKDSPQPIQLNLDGGMAMRKRWYKGELQAFWCSTKACGRK
jgi:hypothetical protein